MAIEKTAKRPAQDVSDSIKTKKRHVDFADEVMIHRDDSERQDNREFSIKLYRNFVTSALEDLERVCDFFGFPLFSPYSFD